MYARCNQQNGKKHELFNCNRNKYEFRIRAHVFTLLNGETIRIWNAFATRKSHVAVPMVISFPTAAPSQYFIYFFHFLLRKPISVHAMCTYSPAILHMESYYRFALVCYAATY